MTTSIPPNCRTAKRAATERLSEELRSTAVDATNSADARAPAWSKSATTTCAPLRANRRTTSRPMPLAPPTTNAILRLNSASGGIRWSLASSSAQYSMRNVFERVSTGHYVDCVDEELGRNTSFFLVFAEAEQAQSRNNDHRWVGIAELG